MARIPTIDDQKLLQSAREVFLEQGFNARVTDIAEQAGISSGSIFRRYPDKKTLFLSAMETPVSWTDKIQELEANQDLKQTLEQIAVFILEHFRITLPCEIMVAAQRFELQTQIMKQVEILAEFLDQELERGRLRPSLNTTLTAETIIGTMHHFASGQPQSQPAKSLRR